MNFVLSICGGLRDGEVLVKTTSLPLAVTAAETLLEELEDAAAIEIKFYGCPAPQSGGNDGLHVHLGSEAKEKEDDR